MICECKCLLKLIGIRPFFILKCLLFDKKYFILDRKVISLHTLLLLLIIFYFCSHNICVALITLYNIKMVSNKPNIYLRF